MKKSTAAKIFGGLAAALGAGLIGVGVSKFIKKNADETDEDLDLEAECEEEEETEVDDSEEDE